MAVAVPPMLEKRTSVIRMWIGFRPSASDNLRTCTAGLSSAACVVVFEMFQFDTVL